MTRRKFFLFLLFCGASFEVNNCSLLEDSQKLNLISRSNYTLSKPERKWLLKFNNRSESIDCKLSGESSLCRDSSSFLLNKESLVDAIDLEPEDSWFENVPLPSIALAKSKTLDDGLCKSQLKAFIRDLRNGTIWAAQMFDSSAKTPYALIDGQTTHLGSFDECYRLDVQLGPDKNSKENHVQGRYCLVDFKYQQTGPLRTDLPKKFQLDFDPHESVWEAIREKGDFRRIKRYMLRMALCVPASCSAEDVVKGLQGPYDEFSLKNNVKVKISVDERNCQAYHEEPEFKTSTFIYCGTLLCLALLVVVSTLYDGTLQTEEEKNSTSRNMQLLLCFSARRNLKTIFDVSYNHRGLDTIHMIRFFSMCLVLVGHRMMEYYFNTAVNLRYLELTFNVPSFIMVHNGTIIVDGFFAIGGLLTCYGLLDQFDKTKRMNFVGLTLIRFLRFTPAYALVVFFHATLFPYLGSGPQWKSRVAAESEYCSNTWWANIFYLNNYLTMDKLCIFQSWYMSVDFHCYLLTIVVIYGFWKWPRKVGYSILGTLIFISIAIPFYVTVMNRLQPVFIGFPYLNNLSNDPYFVKHYVVTHMRMSSYLVGVVSGAILYDYRDSKWRLSKAVSQGLFILLPVLTSIYSQSLGFEFYNPNNEHSLLKVALYASLHRAAFAAATCSIVLLITMGDGLDFHYNFLTPRWVQPLGRLTYSVFLSHNLIQQYQVAVVRAPRTFSIHTTVWNFIPDVIFSFSLALLIAIGIEGPFRKIEKHFIVKRSERKPVSENLPKQIIDAQMKVE